MIPATEGRIAILGCRIDSDGESGSDSRSAHLREGDESDSSPDHSYDDAPDDFDRVHHSRYEHAFPEVGDGRHDHGESTVRGDIKIFYTITYDHGNLVGDGNVGVGHIDSGNADDGDVLTADGSGGAAFEAPTGGGGGGTDDQTAAEVTVDTTNFSSNLTAADDTVQAALETIDGFTQYQGTWQQAAWPAGVIVRRSGIPYLSLVNNNTEIPTPASTQWTGLSEGFVYRGAAPVVATNYNYGQVVLEPNTDVYYYFTSTISASVARADIATHANFQAISGETGHSPRVDSGSAFPTTPAPLAGDLFFFDADVASGLDWLDTDGTTDLTAATAGDMARFDGTDWIKVINLVGGGGGGGGGSTDFFDAPIEDVASIDVSNTTPENYLAIDANNVITNRGGFTIEVGTNTHQAIKVPVDGNYTITAVTSILQNNAGVPRNRTRFQFFIVRSGVDVAAAGSGLYASYGRATVPAGFADGSYTVDLLADDQIEMRYSDELATTATYSLGGGLSRISVLLNSGGGTTGGQQATSGLQTTQIFDRNATGATLTVYPLGTALSAGDDNHFTFTEVDKESVDRIEIMILVASQYWIPIVITREMLYQMTPQAGHPGTVNNTEDSGGLVHQRQNDTVRRLQGGCGCKSPVGVRG